MKFLYNPANDQILNATPMLLNNMDRLKLVPASETILRAKRPDLFESAAVVVAAATPVPVAPSEEDEFLAPVSEPEKEDLGVTMDPNRLTLLVDAIGQLDPATGFTKEGVPVPAKMAKIVGSSVSAAERDFAFAEYKREQAE